MKRTRRYARACIAKCGRPATFQGYHKLIEEPGQRLCDDCGDAWRKSKEFRAYQKGLTQTLFARPDGDDNFKDWLAKRQAEVDPANEGGGP